MENANHDNDFNVLIIIVRTNVSNLKANRTLCIDFLGSMEFELKEVSLCEE